MLRRLGVGSRAPQSFATVDTSEQAVVDAVLGLAAAAEYAAFGPVGLAPYRVDGRIARREEGAGVGPLSDPWAAAAAEITGGRVVVHPLRSAVVVAGKFADPLHRKVRTYLPPTDGLPAATLKVWGGASLPLAERECAVRASIAGIPGYRALPVLASGEFPGGQYLLEPLLHGRHPRDMNERREAAGQVIASLTAAWSVTGIRSRRLRGVVGRGFRRQVLGVLGDPDLAWDRSWGGRTELVGAVGRLIDRNGTLPCVLGHGDLVPSNMIRDEGGQWWLTDWEQARELPAAFDLAKLLLACGDLDATGGVAARALEPFDTGGRRGYPWPHQVALGVCRMLAMAAARRERAHRVGRGDAMERQLRQHVAWLARLVGDRPVR